MKYVRVTAAPDLDVSPEIFQLLAASPHVTRARLLSWRVTEADDVTMLFAVHGDRDGFSTALDDIPSVVDADVTPDDDSRFYFLATIRPPLFEGIFRLLAERGLLVITPVLYHDGKVHASVVGRTAAVQATLDRIPPAIDVTVHEIGERGFEPESARAALSDRQREAVRAAIELGYYETPRKVTYEDIASHLDCAPSTASEHLQKAEAKIVRSTMTEAVFSESDSRLP